MTAEWMSRAGQFSLLLEEEASISEPGWVQHESGHLMFHFLNGRAGKWVICGLFRLHPGIWQKVT